MNEEARAKQALALILMETDDLHCACNVCLPNLSLSIVLEMTIIHYFILFKQDYADIKQEISNYKSENPRE